MARRVAADDRLAGTAGELCVLGAGHGGCRTRSWLLLIRGHCSMKRNFLAQYWYLLVGRLEKVVVI